MIVDWVLLAVLGITAPGWFHAGRLVVLGWQQARDRLTEIKPTPPAAVPDKTLDDLLGEQDAFWTRYETALFNQVPTAWWLDPNRWGEVRPERPAPRPYLEADPPIPAMMPRCPQCGFRDKVHVATEHGEEATSWDCDGCAVTFTKQGVTHHIGRKIRGKISAGKQLAADLTNYKLDLPVSPNATLPDRDAPPPPRRPACGCEPGVPLERNGPLKDGTVWVRCLRCHRWWEPPSNGGDGVAQGERIHDRDEMTPSALRAWGKLVNSPDRNHGACPSETCQFPVDKRDGKYYCTNSHCDHYYRGWK